LIQNSPHAFGDVFISFTEHDRGRNHHAVTLNHEVWLMLLGTNVDFWSDAHIHKIILDHDQVIAWEEDHNNLARVLVKARVVNLEDIPWFIVSTEGPGFEGDSLTIQTEIIQSRMLGVNAADEDVPPGPDDLQPEFFDFFGFGQPHLEPVPVNEPNEQNMEVQQDAQGVWGLWPEQPANQNEQQGLNVHQEVAFDLNEPGEAPLEDPGLVENVPGHVDDPWPQHLIDEDVIVASSDSEGHNEEAAQIPILPDLNDQVEVFIPMDDDGQTLQFIPDEIPEEDLVPDINGLDNVVQDIAVQEQPHSLGAPDAMHLGFVSWPDDLGDPVFIDRLQQQLHSDVFKQNPDAIHLWARFLAPGPGASSVKVPRVWADFFTALLLNPSSYEWAKKLLQSKAWEFFQATSCESVPFCFPPARLTDKNLFCHTHASVGNASSSEQMQSPEGTSSQTLFSVTPPDKIKEKVVTTPGPWSQQLLDLAAQNKISDQALCPANRRSAR
jgi:hypothetical protein